MNYFGCGRVIRQFLGEPDLFMQKHPALRNIGYKMTARDVKNRILEHLAKLPYAIWENQFNLFDSHDTSRLHNNPKVNREEYRGAVMFQFMLPGAASVYYGDEAEIDGYTDSMEGCRYPMPWHKDFRTGERYRLVQTLAGLKAEHAALRSGSMKILYAEGNIFAMARFSGEEAFVCIISTEEEDKTIRLPLGAIGASCPDGTEDIFGRMLCWEEADKHSIRMKVGAHQSYLFSCKIG
jgi:alpha-glucosidase